MSFPLLRLAAAACVGVLGGCGGREAPASGPAANPASYDGAWSGRAYRMDDSAAREGDCPELLPVVWTVADGRVNGELRHPRDRTVSASTFDGFIDAGGNVAVRIYFNNRTNELIGRLRGDTFDGSLFAPLGCRYVVRLQRSQA